MLVATLVLLFLVSRHSLDIAERVSRHDQMIQRIQSMFSTLQDAETGQRGYLLTGNSRYLDPYRRAVDEMPEHMAELAVASIHGLAPQEMTSNLKAKVSEKLGELGRTVRLATSGDATSAMEIVMSDSGANSMDEVRALVDKLLGDQRSRRLAMVASARKAEATMAAVFAGVVLLNLAFLAWAYLRINNEVYRTTAADAEARHTRDFLAVSLASIGDAVILTDTNGVITFFNDVAADLTGWTSDEAIGRPCAEVFSIINESTRKTAESPVDQVLATGRIVELSNHTVLLRKDGSEIPIDDSGAPVRKDDGEIRGVVLVFRDFSKHKEAENVLVDVKQRLELANRAKDDFIAALSHELRTPLTPVLATLSSWEKDGSIPEALENDVRMLNRNVGLEVRLIDDLLDFTRILRGNLAMRPTAIDVHDVLRSVVEIHRTNSEARGLRVGLRLVAGHSMVLGDSARLQQVFWNIIGNAIKFTPEGGRIEIVTVEEAGNIRIDVADNGRGMTAEELAEIFEPFDRSEKEHGYGPTGLGIGLNLSQGLVKAHGGEIEARSDGENLGSTFTIRLPLLEKLESADRGEVPGEESPLEHKSLRILLVEDHSDTADVLVRILRRMGHAAETCASVDEAIKTLRLAEFDLVLTDIGLPDGDGIQLLHKARTFTDVPVIAVTGYGRDDDIARYREEGFLDQLTKPIRVEQLQECLDRYFETSGEDHAPA